jgi:hypothetical protein
VLGNVVFGVAAALMLVGIWTLRGVPVGGWKRGALWGLAAFGTLYQWPSYGLPPELPGMAVTPLTVRQEWWLLAALSFAGASAVLTLGAAEDDLSTLRTFLGLDRFCAESPAHAALRKDPTGGGLGLGITGGGGGAAVK